MKKLTSNNVGTDVSVCPQTAGGITLIALVVTIIVLVILVGIVLNLISSGDGVIAKARWSQYVTEYEQVDEAKEMYVSQRIMDKYYSLKKVNKIYKIADSETTQATVDTNYPVNTKLNIGAVSDTLKQSIMQVENVYEEDLIDESKVNLYQVDFSKIDVTAERDYAINIVTGMLYSIQSESYQDKIYHTPSSGIDQEVIIQANQIKEPGTYELIIDAGSNEIAEWEMVRIYYEKYVENSLTCKVYTSDDKKEWKEEAINSEVYVVSPQKFEITDADKTRYLKIEIEIKDIGGENSELNYILVNYYKYKTTSITPVITETGTTQVGGIYTVATPSDGEKEAQGTATVKQTIIVPNDGGNYILNLSDYFGNPETIVTVAENNYTVNDLTKLKNISLPGGSTVEVTTTLLAGDGVGKVELLVADTTVTSIKKDKANLEGNNATQNEWKTEAEKIYLYNNGGRGFWERALLNGDEIDSTGIISTGENKRIKITYQTSSDGDTWSSEFANIQDAENIQNLKVNMRYQVYGDNDYGTRDSDVLTVILNDGSWKVTIKDEDGTELGAERVYFTSAQSTAGYTLPTKEDKTGKLFAGWQIGNQTYAGGVNYTLTANTEILAKYINTDIYTVEDLVAFRDAVNVGNSFSGKTINLKADLDLSSVCSSTKGSWVPIGNSDTTRFEGIFDGDGKTISGLYINNSSAYQGLFGLVGTGGQIKNITCEGSVKVSGYGGGISGYNLGLITRCINKATVSTNGNVYNIGGISGWNYGTIVECANRGTISGYDGVGGIAGAHESGAIKKCCNFGTIYASVTGAGGIAGGTHGSGAIAKIFNSYNNASVTAGSYWAGGIMGSCGWSGGTAYIYNCYTIKNTTILGRNFRNYNGSNNYTTNATVDGLNGGIDEVGGTNTETPWVADTNNINGGYPILSWQNE